MDRSRTIAVAAAAVVAVGAACTLTGRQAGAADDARPFADLVRVRSFQQRPSAGRAAANAPMTLDAHSDSPFRLAGHSPDRSNLPASTDAHPARPASDGSPPLAPPRAASTRFSKSFASDRSVRLPAIRVAIADGVDAPSNPHSDHGGGRDRTDAEEPAAVAPAPIEDRPSPPPAPDFDPPGDEAVRLPTTSVDLAPARPPQEPEKTGDRPAVAPFPIENVDSAPPIGNVAGPPFDGAVPAPAVAPVRPGETMALPAVAGPSAALPPHFTADVDALARDPHLSRYAARVRDMPHAEPLPHPMVAGFEMPARELWWETPVARPLWPAMEGRPVDVEALVLRALEHSPDVLALRLEPEILRQAVCEEEAAFDWTAFVESTYDDISDPVGNTLTTGGADRLRDRVLATTAGGRRTNRSGGELELSQRAGYQDNNSQFFLPTQQATSRLSLSYTQPLLNGRGEAYQESRVVLARLDTADSNEQSAEKLQDHLLAVAEAYWDLYRSRCLYLQRRKVLIQAERTLATLEGRAGVDALPRQILRTRSAVTDRRSQIVRAAMDVRNAESRLRMLVGDATLSAAGRTELLPRETPETVRLPMSVAGSCATALMNRPDIRRSVTRLRATGVRLGVAEHELMPRLDLVLSGYLSGLEGAGRFGNSYADQFSEGRPSFAAGMLFEIPLGRRAAKARQHRRQLELVQATHQFEASVESALTEVELAVREVETSYREMASRHQAMTAAENEAAYLEDRWKLMPGGGSASRLLEDLLDAQERLTDEEGGLTTAQVNYLLALANVRRATGTLLQFRPAGCVPCGGEIVSGPFAEGAGSPVFGCGDVAPPVFGCGDVAPPAFGCGDVAPPSGGTLQLMPTAGVAVPAEIVR